MVLVEWFVASKPVVNLRVPLESSPHTPESHSKHRTERGAVQWPRRRGFRRALAGNVRRWIGRAGGRPVRRAFRGTPGWHGRGLLGGGSRRRPRRWLRGAHRWTIRRTIRWIIRWSVCRGLGGKLRWTLRVQHGRRSGWIVGRAFRGSER